MEDTAARFAGVPAGDASDDFLVGHFDGDHGIDDGDGVQGLRLWDGPWEPIEHHALGSVWLRQPFFDDANDDLIGDERPCFHVGLGFLPDRRSCRDGGSKHVPSGHLWLACALKDALCLRAFASPGWTEEDDAAHGRG